MFVRVYTVSRSVGQRFFSKHIGRVITSQSAYLVSEETPLTKFFTRTPKLEEVEKKKLWINEAMEKMTSVDDATAILKRFRENNYFINDKAITSFIFNGMKLDVNKTVNAICDPTLAIFPSEYAANILIKHLGESGNGDGKERVLKHMDMMRSQEQKEEQDNYTPYEHLRTVVENSDFYTFEYKVDIERDILGKQ